MNETEIVDEKFLACTGYSLENFKRFVLRKQYSDLINKFKIDDFRKTIQCHGMEEYTEQLFYYMIMVRHKFDKFPEQWEKSQQVSRQDIEYQEELVLSLKKLLTGGKLNITITNITKPQKIRHQKLNDILHLSTMDKLREAIHKLGLNLHPLTRKEAIAAINSHSDVEWVKNWMESIGYIDPDYENFTLDSFDDYFSKFFISSALPGAKEKLRDELIEEFASDHLHEAQLDAEELDRILKRIKEIKSKPGRKNETIDQKRIAYMLSALIRIERYFQWQDIDTIQEVSVTNKDCRFIHDTMTFFKLVIDYREDFINEQNLEKRIRKMITDYREPDAIEDMNEKLQILKSRLYNRQ